jgi:hypothetical protein
MTQERRLLSVDEAFFQQTVRVWQPYYPDPLTQEDARSITTSMCGFFQLLREWEDRDLAPPPTESQQSEPGRALGPKKPPRR